MKKGFLISIMAIVVLLMTTVGVFAGYAMGKKNKPEEPTTPATKTNAVIAKEKFDAAFASFETAEKYAQTVEYLSFVDGESQTVDTSNKLDNCATNWENGSVKRFFVDGSDKATALFMNLTETNLQALNYDVAAKTYTEENSSIASLTLIKGMSVELVMMQAAYNKGALDIDYNRAIAAIVAQAGNGSTTEYSYKVVNGYDTLKCVVTSTTTKYTLEVLMKDGKVTNASLKEEDIATGDYTQRIHTFNYTGTDLTIDINHGEYTKVS